MSGSIYSPSWYRVAALKPRLRAHARIHRQEFRGETWYVLQDASSERFHRFSPAAYAVIGLMDGRRTLDEVWQLAVTRLGDDAPTQDEVIHLLGQLHAADVLQSDVAPDTGELLDRGQRRRALQWKGQVLNVLGWRLSLVDPERFLARTLPLVRPLCGVFGFVLWLAVVGAGVFLAAMHWRDLTYDFLDRVLAPASLLTMWLVFPVIKALHELGHAYTTKAFGGQVHDMGIMLLVFTPVPYVDASSAWGFPEKHRRLVVGAAGIFVELVLASLALFVWLAAQPGVVRAVAYNVIIVAGVSSLVFNLNPLLRFDGYYVLSDLLEIPNLRSRANAYFAYLCERYLFGRRESERPAASPGERAWFLGFGVSAFVYRAVVAVSIVLYLTDVSLLLGAVLGTAAIVGWLGVPLVRGAAYLAASPRLARARPRAILVTLAGVALLAALLGYVRVPLRTVAEGVVFLPDEAVVRAGTAGFVERVAARPGSEVRTGDVLVVCRDPILEAEVAALEAKVREISARYAAEWVRDRVKADLVRQELAYADESLARARERLAALVVRSRTDGTFVAPLAKDLPGRFVKQGEVLGHVVDLATVTIRTVVSQDEVDLVRHRTAEVRVRLAERLDLAVPALVAREVPGGTVTLPSAALGSAGGGRFAVDPRDPEGRTALQRVFQLDVEISRAVPVVNVGGRAYVRFDHGREPLAQQWYRKVRQLFLARFDV